MKILVTGANGFLGSCLVRALANRGDHVRVLHRPRSDMSLLTELEFESVIGDVTDPHSVLEACRGMEVVFHAAGLISYSTGDRQKMELVNVKGTDNIIQAVIQNRVQRLVHTSSVVAVGASRSPQILNEESPYNLSSFDFGYYETKRKGEILVRDAARKGLLDAVIVNPAIIVGPGDFAKGTRKLHWRVVKGHFPFYPSGGCNLVDSDDAVEGHLSALVKGRRGERYILSGENVTIREYFKMLALCGNTRPPFIPLPEPLLRSLYHVAKDETAYISTLFHWYDHSKAQQELGLNFKRVFSAIQRSVEWKIKREKSRP